MAAERAHKALGPLLRNISQVTDYMYLSGFMPVNEFNLKDLAITCVIDATNIPRKKCDNCELIRVPVDDSEFAKIHVFFDSVVEAMHRHRTAGGKILVHCAAGISRSTSICLAYMMRHDGMSLRDAYLHVVQRRPMACPNNGFWRQLIDYERRLRGDNSVQMVAAHFGSRQMPDVFLHKVRQQRAAATADSSSGGGESKAGAT